MNYQYRTDIWLNNGILWFQWFGNLVTCDWWTDIWLNNGIAAYFEVAAFNDVFQDNDPVSMSLSVFYLIVHTFYSWSCSRFINKVHTASPIPHGDLLIWYWWHFQDISRFQLRLRSVLVTDSFGSSLPVRVPVDSPWNAGESMADSGTQNKVITECDLSND